MTQNTRIYANKNANEIFNMLIFNQIKFVLICVFLRHLRSKKLLGQLQYFG
jgi:hypothetical protein